MGRGRSKAKKDLDRVTVAALMRRGYSDAAIAQKMGVRVETITKDVEAILKELAKNTSRDRELMVTRMREQYSHIQQCAIEDYETSRMPTTQLFGNEPVVTPTVGDQGTLRTAMMAMEGIRDLTGMDYPQPEERQDAVSTQKAIEEVLPVIQQALEAHRAALADKNTSQAPSEPIETKPFDLTDFLNDRKRGAGGPLDDR
jgi:hypothetical protein